MGDETTATVVLIKIKRDIIMKELNINGYKETIIERSDYPLEKCKNILKNEWIVSEDSSVNYLAQFSKT